MVGQDHGDGVDLLSGRTGGAPDVEGAFRRVLGQHLLAEKVEVLFFAEEVGLVGGEQVHH